MPVLKNANLSSVSTEFKPYPEGEYLIRVESSEVHQDGAQLRIISKIEEPAEFAGRTFTDFINLVKNDGKRNDIGYTTVKRYLEAVFGKGSPEADAEEPDTDALNGSALRIYLVEETYKDKSGAEKPTNRVKHYLPA